jgi:hypothetical protein
MARRPSGGGISRKVHREAAEADDARLDALELGPTLPVYAVAGLPAAADNDYRVVYCSNGATGSPCLAVSNGTNWLRVVFGAAVAAS